MQSLVGVPLQHSSSIAGVFAAVQPCDMVICNLDGTVPRKRTYTLRRGKSKIVDECSQNVIKQKPCGKDCL